MSPCFKNIIFAALILMLAACGSGGVASDNPPDVEGTYACTDGCNGPTCIFDGTLTISQNGDDFIISSGAFDDAVGSINNEGEFDVENDTMSCDGQVVDDIAIANCTVEGTDCQQVTYELQ